MVYRKLIVEGEFPIEMTTLTRPKKEAKKRTQWTIKHIIPVKCFHRNSVVAILHPRPVTVFRKNYLGDEDSQNLHQSSWYIQKNTCTKIKVCHSLFFSTFKWLLWQYRINLIRKQIKQKTVVWVLFVQISLLAIYWSWQQNELILTSMLSDRKQNKHYIPFQIL